MARVWNHPPGLRPDMKCPYCREGNFAVVDSRNQDGKFPIRRRRVCDRCQRKVWTVETVEEATLKVVKKDDQRREPFDAGKLRRGLEKACYKRPITKEQIDTLVRQIEDEVHACYYGEVPASVIGDLAMEHLQRLDQVAYVRFASVYREFKDVSDFVQLAKKRTNGDVKTRRRGDGEARQRDDAETRERNNG